MYSSPGARAAPPRRRQPSADSVSRRRAMASVSLGSGDETLHPRHLWDERPRLVRAPDRLQRGIAQLRCRPTGFARRGERLGQREPGRRSAHRGVAGDRGLDELSGPGEVPGREGHEPGVVLGERVGRWRVEPLGRGEQLGGGLGGFGVAAEPGQQMCASRQAGEGDDREAAGRLDAPVGDAQRAVEVAVTGQRAGGARPDHVVDVGPGEALGGGGGAQGRRLARREVPEPDGADEPGGLELGDRLGVRFRDERHRPREQGLGLGRITGRRFVPGEAEQHLGAQRRRRVRGKEIGGAAVGRERGGRVAGDRLEPQPAATPRGGLVGGREQRDGRFPCRLEVVRTPEPRVGLGELDARSRVGGVGVRRLGPERGRLRQRPERAGVVGRALPLRSGEVVTAGLLQVARDLGGTGVGAHCRRGGLDGQRHREMGPRGVAQVGPRRLGKQRMSVAEAAVDPAGEPGVEHLPFRIASCGQRGDLGRRQRAVRPRPSPRPARGRQAGPRPAPPARPHAGSAAGAALPSARVRAVSTASSGLPSAAATISSSAGWGRVATPRTISASSLGRSGPSSISATSIPRPARSTISASASGRSGRSRRVRTNSTGIGANLRPMWAHSARLARSARWMSSATRSNGRSAADHSTSRSTASNTRSRSSSGAATAGSSASAPRAPARSGASLPSSAGHRAAAGGGRTTATSARASSCQTASGASPPTSTPAPTATRAPPCSARRASSATMLVLPMPASPVMTTTRPPRPLRAAAHAAVRSVSSLARPYSARDRAGPGVAVASGPRNRASSALVAAAGAMPSWVRSRAASSWPTTRAAAGSPAATRRSISSRWAGSSSGVSAHRRAASAAAVDGSVAAATSRSNRVMRRRPVFVPRGAGPVVVEAGTRLAVPVEGRRCRGPPGPAPPTLAW